MKTMTKALIAATLLSGAAVAAPASATIVVAGSGSITSTDAATAGRVFRDGNPSTWAAPKSYPGDLDNGTQHAYDLLNATFASNAFQAIYYEITFSTTETTNLPFSIAYLNAFDPSNLGMNYLGDAGSSPISGSVSFQVIVPTAQQLILNFQGVSTNLPINYSYSVSAFSDAARGENFIAGVPEPTTWAMMLVGFGMMGAAMRYRRRSTNVAFA